MQVKYFKIQDTIVFNNSLFLMDVFPLNFHFIIPTNTSQVTLTVIQLQSTIKTIDKY